MLAVEVELLTGRYVATRYNDRNRVEWPPHPARLFSAAVAAWADADEPSDAERDALVWWERLGAPEIMCSSGDRFSERSTVTHYVPVNDTQVVARDTSGTYRVLRAAMAEAANAPDEDPKAQTRARKALAGLQQKASDDSLRAATAGSAPGDALKILPEQRGRQGRTYPTAIPETPVITFRWPDSDPEPTTVQVLDSLLARIGRLGHSSSLVDVRATNATPDVGASADVADEVTHMTTFEPAERGQLAIRVAADGQLDMLERAFASHGGTEPRVLPAEMVRYGEHRPGALAIPEPVFSMDWFVIKPVGDRFAIRDTLGLARSVRSALMSHADDPIPEILSGHAPSSTGAKTKPSDRPHLAIVGLPFVDHRRADGSLQGLAVIAPRCASAEEIEAVWTAAGRWLRPKDEGGGGGILTLGRQGREVFHRADSISPAWTLQSDRWSAPAAGWSSVTPIALDRHPGDLGHRDPDKRDAARNRARDSIAAACRNIGLPIPTQVAVRLDAPVTGSRDARSFPPYAVKGGALQRALVHAELAFDQPVRGPILLGAGRYYGYGLCAPRPDDLKEVGA